MLKVDVALYPESLLDIIKRKMSKIPDTISSISMPKFIFLCGESEKAKTGSLNRKLVKHYYKQHAEGLVFPIFVEKLWKLTEASADIDLLTYELFIAEISDKTLLFMESLGTAAELGAFVNIDDIMEKLIVVNDNAHEGGDSFITLGPIKKIFNEVGNNNLVYCNMNSSMGSRKLNIILRDIARLRKTKTINRNKENVSISSYILEIIDIISLIGPIEEKQVVEVYKYLKGFKKFEFSNKKFMPIYAIELLKYCNLLSTKESIVSINSDLYKINYRNLFMFKMTERDLNEIRSKFLAKKYKYKK